MLRKLIIQNFENHRKTVLPFSDGVNVIIGETDAGKSAIIRSLDWVCNNKPSGSSFLRVTAKKATKVLLSFDKKRSVQRKKGGKKNTYKLDGEPFTAFGQKVPDEISQALNLQPLNWHRQVEPHFLLSDSPPEVARRLNSVVDLSDIDQSLSTVLTKEKQLNTQERNLKVDLQDKQEQLVKYKGLAKLDGMLVALEQLDARQKHLTSKAKALQKLIAQYKDKKEQLAALDVEAIKEATMLLSGLSTTLREWQSKQDMTERLEQILDSGNKIMNKITHTESFLILLKKKYKNLMPDVCPLCKQEIHSND